MQKFFDEAVKDVVEEVEEAKEIGDEVSPMVAGIIDELQAYASEPSNAFPIGFLDTTFVRTF